KAYTGELKGLKTPELFARKVAFERNFRKAVAAKPALESQYGMLWDEIADRRRQIAKLAPMLNGLNPQRSLVRSQTLATALDLLQFAGAASSGQVADSTLAGMKAELLAVHVDAELDAAILAAQLEDARRLLGPADPWVSRALSGRTPVEAARAIVSGSAIPDSARRAALVGSPTSIMNGTDPAIQLIRAGLPRMQQLYGQYHQLINQEEVRTGKLAKALISWIA